MQHISVCASWFYQPFPFSITHFGSEQFGNNTKLLQKALPPGGTRHPSQSTGKYEFLNQTVKAHTYRFNSTCQQGSYSQQFQLSSTCDFEYLQHQIAESVMSALAQMNHYKVSNVGQAAAKQNSLSRQDSRHAFQTAANKHTQTNKIW